MPIHPLLPRRRLLGLVVLYSAALLASLACAPFDAAAQQGPVPAPVQVPPSPAGAPPAPSLTQNTWQWQQTQMSDGTTIAAQDPSRYTVTFLPDGRLAIRADCNNAAGTYTTSGAQLTLQLGPTTLAACPPDSQADVFLRGLGAVVTYIFDGPRLVLNLRIDSGNMIFIPEPPLPLVGTNWQLQSYNNGRGGVVSLQAQTQISAVFGADGNLSGSAGCNTYRGAYTASGQSISIGPLATTRMACPQPIMDQEQAYLAALGRATTYTIGGGRLTLRDGTGATQAVYVPAPTPPAGAQPAPRSPSTASI